MQNHSQTHGREVGAQAMTPTPRPHTGGIRVFPPKHLRHCFAVEGSRPGATGQGRSGQGENRRALVGGSAGDGEVDCHGVADGHMDACGEPAHCQPNPSRSPTRFELVSKVRSDPFTEARKSLLLVLVFATADELHQSFVPSRVGTPWDVLIDCSGGALALWLLWLLGRRLKWW